MDYTIYEAKTKDFVFAYIYTKSRYMYSHDAAHILLRMSMKKPASSIWNISFVQCVDSRTLLCLYLKCQGSTSLPAKPLWLSMLL